VRLDLEEGHLLALGLPQHADSHRPERPILLAVDQQLDFIGSLYVGVILADI
jgi:hypothetical protein